MNFYDTFDERKAIITLSRNKSICGGDSGGPLVQLNDEKRYVLVGITVGTSPLCRDPLPKGQERISTFADVRQYVDWICERTGVCPTSVAKSKTQCTMGHFCAISNWFNGYGSRLLKYISELKKKALQLLTILTEIFKNLKFA
ncbi:hypothetical protein GCK32_016964 [Trichostrongylus colubriformis]|uniref:Peptidase S1 domain-containing protein n=1 Tax=Trichostrongylus colubriformis TaxID=6319 RepID=A0AAN8FJV4_TRICO